MKLNKIGSLLLCTAVFISLMSFPSFALEKGVYVGSVITSYTNPDTGNVDDGGTANAALGEGMCRSATAETALVEYDGSNTWVTVRLLLQSNCSNVAFYTRNGYNSYSRVNYSITAENAAEDSIDYRFKVSDAGVKIKGTMYVTPMGRDVLWYLYINTNTLKSGSGDFEVSIDVSEPASSAKSTYTAGASGGSANTGGSTAQGTAGTAAPAQAPGVADGANTADGISDAADGVSSDGAATPENAEAEDAAIDGESVESAEIIDIGSDDDKIAKSGADGIDDSGRDESSGGYGIIICIAAAVIIAAGAAAFAAVRRRKSQ